MSSFPLKPLSEISTIFSGYAFKGEDMISNGDIPIIKIANIQNRLVTPNSVTSIPKNLYTEKLEKYILRPDDVLIAMTGAGSVGNIGKMRRVEKTFLINQRVGIIRINANLADPEFVYQVLSNEDVENKYYQLGLGAGQPNLSPQMIGSQTIPFPPLHIQRKIANVLSAYDDLIEVNARRIRVLEAMAQSVHREWFGKVDEKSLPNGWEMKKLIDECDIIMGQSPASEFYNEDGKGLPFHQGVTDFGDRFPTDRVYCTVENRIAEKGDILFSVRAPVGRINIANKKIVIGRGVSAIRSKTGNQAFVFQQLKDQFQEEDMMGGGTIFKSVTKEDMHNIKFLSPTKDMVEKFEEFANPIFQQLEILTVKNANLRRTRDLLLPRLVSGEVLIG